MPESISVSDELPAIKAIMTKKIEDDIKRLTINPEFLTESNAKEQFVNAEYHVIGGHPELLPKKMKISTID